VEALVAAPRIASVRTRAARRQGRSSDDAMRGPRAVQRARCSERADTPDMPRDFKPVCALQCHAPCAQRRVAARSACTFSLPLRGAATLPCSPARGAFALTTPPCTGLCHMASAHQEAWGNTGTPCIQQTSARSSPPASRMTVCPERTPGCPRRPPMQLVRYKLATWIPAGLSVAPFCVRRPFYRWFNRKPRGDQSSS
jgi:hypothetical protein